MEKEIILYVGFGLGLLLILADLVLVSYCKKSRSKNYSS